MKKKKTKPVRALKQRQAQEQEAAYKEAPHSFVFHRGKLGANVKTLVKDMRKLMEPHTASNLKVGKKNTLKDFISVAGPLQISHFLIFSKTETSVNFKVARLPRGPTLTFKVCEYSLSRDVISSLKRHYTEHKQFEHHPLLVMNNFSGEEMQLKLIATMFQNMFPSINVNKVQLDKIRRCVLMNYDKTTRTMDFRHYNIRVIPVGMSRGMKKIIKAKLPDLSKYDDVSEYIMRGGNLSESEAELDGPENEVTLPQNISSRGNLNQKSAQSAIRLTELGPRMKLKLVKIEEDVCGGDVMFHEYVQKTPAEIQAAKEMKKKKKNLKEQRRQKQEENVKRKEKKKAEHKEKSLSGMKKAQEKLGNIESVNPNNEDDITDADYYRQEVGSMPDADWFPSSGKKRKVQEETDVRPKKMKIEKLGKERRKRNTENDKKQELDAAKKKYFKNLEKKRLMKKKAKAKKMKYRPKK